MKKMTGRDCVEMHDYLYKKGLEVPEVAEDLYKKAKANGYVEGPYFGKIPGEEANGFEVSIEGLFVAVLFMLFILGMLKML